MTLNRVLLIGAGNLGSLIIKHVLASPAERTGNTRENTGVGEATMERTWKNVFTL